MKRLLFVLLALFLTACSSQNTNNNTHSDNANSRAVAYSTSAATSGETIDDSKTDIQSEESGVELSANDEHENNESDEMSSIEIANPEVQILRELEGGHLYNALQKTEELGYEAKYYIYDSVFDELSNKAENASDFSNRDFYPVIDLKEAFWIRKVYEIDAENKTVKMDYEFHDITYMGPYHATSPSAQETTSNLVAVVDESEAFTAVEQYGEKQYPYGFKVHAFGAYSETTSKGGWSIVAEVEITNAFGATQTAEVYAVVQPSGSGTCVVEKFEVR